MFTEPPRSAETHARAGRAQVINLFCRNKKYSTAVDTTRVCTQLYTRDQCLKVRLLYLLVPLLLLRIFAFLEHLYRTARLFDYKRQNFMVRPRIHVLTMKILKAPLPRHPYLQYL